eukprot:7138332-Ditylum_brightwellii.AAC.2
MEDLGIFGLRHDVLSLTPPSKTGSNVQPAAAVMCALCALCAYDMDPRLNWVSNFLVPSRIQSLDSISRGVLRNQHLYMQDGT